MSSISLEKALPREVVESKVPKEKRKSDESGPMTHPSTTQKEPISLSQRSSDQGVHISEVEEIQLSSLGEQDQPLEDGQLVYERSREMAFNLPSRTSTNNAFLPPVDGGKQAWSFLTAGFFIDFCVWGFVSQSKAGSFFFPTVVSTSTCLPFSHPSRPLFRIKTQVFSYGVFQSHLSSSSSPFVSSSGKAPSSGFVSAVGTVSIALLYSLPVILSNLFTLRPHYIKPLMVSGLVLSCGSLLAGSFSNSIGVLLFTQGIGFGVGAGLVFTPVMLWIPEWFYEKRGLATGIVFCECSKRRLDL